MTLVNNFRLIIDSTDQPVELLKALFWRVLRIAGYSTRTIDEQVQDRIAAFDEYPQCDVCRSESNTEQLTATDGSRLVECDSCGQWFTSPRIREDLWYKYLKTPSQRNSEFTKNRLEYGVALTANTRYVFPGWRKAKFRENKSVIEICLVNF